jgi:hypothetical protein
MTKSRLWAVFIPLQRLSTRLNWRRYWLPDYFLGMGQVDDLVILLVGLRMFISLCPPGVVAEFNRLRGNPDGMEDWEDDEVEIIDLDAEAPKRHSDGSDT